MILKIIPICITIPEDYIITMKNYDNLEIRCPRLGGEVTFSYCEQEGGDNPCVRIITCWQSFFPVEAYLKGRMSQEAWERFLGHAPKDKVSTLIELIEAAKIRKKKDNE